MSVGYSVENVRKHNLKVIAELLFEESLSCNEIATRIGISETAVKKNVLHLMQYGFVVMKKEEKVELRSRGGQHIRYRINGENGAFLCLSFSNDGDWFVITDFSFSSSHYEELRLPVDVMSVDVKGVIDKVKEVIRQKRYKALRGIAIAISGQIDNETGDFIYSSRFDNSDLNSLVGLFSQEFHAPIFIRNDVQYDVLGELQRADYSKNTTVLYIRIGRGVSGAVVNNGRFITGVRGFAGEMGMMHAVGGGFLHGQCAMWELVRKCEPYLTDYSVEALFEAYETVDEVKEIVLDSAKILAESLNDFTLVLGIDKIVLLGEAQKFGEPYRMAMQKAFASAKKVVFERQILLADEKNIRLTGMKKDLQDKVIARIVV